MENIDNAALWPLEFHPRPTRATDENGDRNADFNSNVESDDSSSRLGRFETSDDRDNAIVDDLDSKNRHFYAQMLHRNAGADPYQDGDNVPVSASSTM